MSDVHSCLTGTTRKTTLKPIEVGEPFHRVKVDVLQLPLLRMETDMFYLTKWVEAFVVPNHTAETISKLLLE